MSETKTATPAQMRAWLKIRHRGAALHEMPVLDEIERRLPPLNEIDGREGEKPAAPR